MEQQKKEETIIIQGDTVEPHPFSLAVINGKPELQGIEALKNVVDRKVKVMQAQAVNIGDPANCDTLRTDNNNYVKEVEQQITDAEKKYLEPFDAVIKQITDALQPLKDENKAFAQRILEAKKARFKETVRAEFSLLALADANGELPDFETIYDPAWYGKTASVWKQFLALKLKKERESTKKVVAYVKVTTDQGKLDDLEAYLISNRIVYEINKDL